MLKDAKYLLAYTLPALAFVAVAFGGLWSYAAVVFAFVILPFIELFTANDGENNPPESENSRAVNLFFDIMLYLNVPVLYALIYYYLDTVTTISLATYEIIGMTLSVGVIVGAVGINVAHELGHRIRKYEQTMAKILLLTALYMHFYVEHNRGHHLKVATPEDPATSRFGESVYAFWWRSIINSYLDAWKLEADRLQKIGKGFWTWDNEVLRFQIIQIAYLVAVVWLFGWGGVAAAIAIAVIGFLQLETVNYIEHYGLLRRQKASGRYENVQPIHSWNSNHDLGRIFLYELTRHSDHHFKATRKYQVLRHFEEAPQLPTGYPGAMLLSLMPPLWFKIMNPKVEEARMQVG